MQKRAVIKKLVRFLVTDDIIVVHGARQVGKTSIYYWRTTDKKEIDFILRRPDYALPIEIKLRFPHTLPRAINIFTETYQKLLHESTPFKLVALQGQPEEPEMVYPWQI